MLVNNANCVTWIKGWVEVKNNQSEKDRFVG